MRTQAELDKYLRKLAFIALLRNLDETEFEGFCQYILDLNQMSCEHSNQKLEQMTLTFVDLIAQTYLEPKTFAHAKLIIIHLRNMLLNIQLETPPDQEVLASLDETLTKERHEDT